MQCFQATEPHSCVPARQAQSEFDTERARLRLEITTLQQSLATVTGDRDSARSELAFYEEQLQLARQQAEQKLNQVPPLQADNSKFVGPHTWGVAPCLAKKIFL